MFQTTNQDLLWFGDTDSSKFCCLFFRQDVRDKLQKKMWRAVASLDSWFFDNQRHAVVFFVSSKSSAEWLTFLKPKNWSAQTKTYVLTTGFLHKYMLRYHAFFCARTHGFMDRLYRMFEGKWIPWCLPSFVWQFHANCRRVSSKNSLHPVCCVW